MFKRRLWVIIWQAGSSAIALASTLREKMPGLFMTDRVGPYIPALRSWAPYPA